MPTYDFSAHFTGGGGLPQGEPIELPPGAGTFYPSVDGMWFWYEITAAGAGGGQGDTTNGGGGGGAAATKRGVVKVPSTGFAYIRPAAAAAGTNGGPAQFGRILVPGGVAGQARSAGGRGGNGGGPAPISFSHPLATASGGNLTTYVPEGVTPGGAGGDSYAVAGATGGAAMPAGYPLSGLPASQIGITIATAPDQEGADGGSSEFGDGGQGGAYDTVGGNATGYGAGGGGGGKAGTGTKSGGTGSGGRIYLVPLGVW